MSESAESDETAPQVTMTLSRDFQLEEELFVLRIVTPEATYEGVVGRREKT